MLVTLGTYKVNQGNAFFGGEGGEWGLPEVHQCFTVKHYLELPTGGSGPGSSKDG